MENVFYEVTDSIAKIRLNRPNAINAFNKELLKELNEILDTVAIDPQVKVIVLSGNGEKGFSAGFDIKEGIGLPKPSVDEKRAETRYESDTWLKIWDMKKPVIGQIHGYCLGGAFGLALMCDLIIASEDAQFGEPEIEFGYIPHILIEPWKIPMNKVKEIMFLGELFDAHEGYRIGVVNKIVPKEELEAATMKVAYRLAKMPSSTLSMCKHQLNKNYEIQGFKNVQDFVIEMFSLSRLNETEESRKFEEIVKEKGFKAALEWQRNQ
jgi:enoyl-CoA hydratase